MSNIKIDIIENGITTLATAGKYCDRNVDIEVNVPSTGGGGGEPPEEAFSFTGDCGYLFANNKWAWFIDMYGNKITTKDITNAEHLFKNSTQLEKIPFDINLAKTVSSLNNMFNGAKKLKQLPLIKGEINPPTGDYSGNTGMMYMFNGCFMLREIPDDYFDNFGGEAFWDAAKTYSGSMRSNIFTNCYSLRRFPNTVRKLANKSVGYSSIYSGLLNYCASLDEVVDCFVVDNVDYTSNSMGSLCDSTFRLSRFTFETNEDNTPKIVNWKSQLLNFSNRVGYGTASYILNYNSGITADKEVKDDATYQALKNDPDWFTTYQSYSRYNHDSAVETINTLPDTSAYLATAGGTNTIKFSKNDGAKTDGGAINTLTAEEIAVATAKGWTVSMV